MFRVEALEQRALLAVSAEVFQAPSLIAFIAAARSGQNTAQASIDRMLTALESQLTSGPLADLTAGSVDGNGFIEEAGSLVSSYSTSVDSELARTFPNVDTLLQLQGQRVLAGLVALNQQMAAGLISSTDFSTQAQAAINALTAGPVYSLSTSLSGYASVTQSLESELNALEQSLSSTTAPVSSADAGQTMLAMTVAYQSDIHASAEVTHPNVSNIVDQAIISLENSAISIESMSSSDAQSAISSSISAFDSAVYGSTGIFGPHGAISQSIASGRGFAPQTTDSRDSSSLTGVSGTTTGSGSATLTATLSSDLNGARLAGVPVFFTLDGAFAGVGVTDSSGVATLSGVPTTLTTGTDTGGVVAYFAGSNVEKSSLAGGDLTVSTVSLSATVVGSVSGTSTFGGTATLTATLTSSATGQPLAGETIEFSLDNNSVGSATTDSNGIATLSGVPTSDGAGTQTGAILAVFAGDSTNSVSTGSGDLVVSQAGTTLGSVSGSADLGGTATLVATLTSNVTGGPAAGETVDFMLNAASVGSATTNSSGVATLTGVANSQTTGTYTGAVVASFAGDTNYVAASSVAGDLTVSSLSATTLASVSGTASFGGTATLTATLTSTATSAAISGALVNFTLNGTAVGSATTDSNGVATLTGVATTAGAGTQTGVVVASFAGDSTNGASTSNGDLVVSQAGTSLGSVSGTLSSGTADLTATLTSSVTGAGIAGVSVEFTIGSTDVGPATTDSNGVATLSVSTDQPSGTGISVAFAGNSDYDSSNGIGTLS